jgi:hypothetical protein
MELQIIRRKTTRAEDGFIFWIKLKKSHPFP